MVAERARARARSLRLPRGWTYAGVVLAPIILLAPFLLGRQVLYWGTPLLQFYPWRALAWEQVRQGSWPLWNALAGNGAPLLANYQAAVLYPPNWLGLVLPLDYAQSWLVALHLAWAGAGMIALAAGLGLGPFGRAMAGLAFGLSQYMVARAGFFSINATAAWLPWLVWAVEGLIRAGWGSPVRLQTLARRALALAIVTALLLLAGHAQTAWYALLLAGLWAAWRLATAGWRLALKPGAWLLAGLALGLGVAAIQLLPTAELLSASPRATAADYDFVVTYSFSPWRLLTLLAPDLLGNPARGRFYGYGNYWEDAVYSGVLPLLLALAAVFSAGRAGLAGAREDGGRRPHAEDSRPQPAGFVPFLLIIAGASLVLGLGANTPIFPIFYRHVPTFNLFQAPTRLLIWLVFALALLAGVAADRWPAVRGRWLYWTRLGTVAAAGFLGVALVAAFAVPADTALGQQVRVVARGLAQAGAGLAAAGALALLRPAGVQPAWWRAAALTVVALDLVYAGWGLNPGGPPDLYRGPPGPTAETVRAATGPHRVFLAPGAEYAAKFDRLLSFASFGPPGLAVTTREALLPNTGMLAGVASANNFEPLVGERYAGLVEVVSSTQSLGLLQLMDVSVAAGFEALGLAEVARLEEAGLAFYAVPGAERVRVYPASAVREVPNAAAALAALASPGFDPARLLVLEANDPSLADRCASLGNRYGGTACSERVLTRSPRAITISVTLDEPGWVFTAENAYPGWLAWVDGQPVPVRFGSYAFLAVAVPAGAHTVVLDYQPGSFALGQQVSAVSLLVCLGLVLAVGRPAGRLRLRQR